MKNKVLFNKNVMRETADGLVACYSRCKDCGKLYFPPEEKCGVCATENMEILPLPQYGNLYSYTVMYRAMPPFKVPHGLAQVEFENGLLIQAIMEIDDPENLKKGDEFEIDSKVEIVTGTIAEDEENEYIGYKARVLK